ncbi:Amino acid permease 6 [Acorus calamus]|uniref:Amino acid permease 6 n=1 Tax=Acorus calamus TaxID=4465 RepID=A0AAV9EUY1_ACOCL|nr:Amino acid permease 6 [Acorus calamus]
MKKASFIGVSITTFFYMLCGVLGYAAFGNDAPGNFLTGFGFYDPFWPSTSATFASPSISSALTSIPLCGDYHFNLFRLVWRTCYVVVTAVVTMIFPFFNDLLGLIGAFSFWPLTVYFPVEMHISQSKIRKLCHMVLA